MGKILLIVGVLGIFVGGLIALVSILLPDITRNVSLDEAFIGVIAGVAVLFISLLPAILGGVLILIRHNTRNRMRQAAAQNQVKYGGDS